MKKHWFSSMLWVLAFTAQCSAHPVPAQADATQAKATQADASQSPATPPQKDAVTQSIQVSSVRFSPDGRLLAAGMTRKQGHESLGREVRLWDVASGRLLRVMEDPTAGIAEADRAAEAMTVLFSPDGQILAGLDMAVKGNKLQKNQGSLWSTSTGRLLHRLPIAEDEFVLSLAFSPDGKVLAGGSGMVTEDKQHSQVRLWDTRTGKLTRSLEGLLGCPCGLAFSPDGRFLAVSSWRMQGEAVLGGEVRVWDVASGRIEKTLAQEKVVVESIVFSPDGKTLATLGYGVEEDNGVGESDVRLWDFQTGVLKQVLTQDNPSDLVKSIAFTPDGQTLMAASLVVGMQNAGAILMWDTQSGRLTKTLGIAPPPDAGDVHHLAADWSPDGKLVAMGMGGGNLQLRRADNGGLVRSFELDPPARSAAEAALNGIVWKEKMARIKPGMSRAQVEQLLSPYRFLSPVRTATGGAQRITYQLDNYWSLGLWYDYTGIEYGADGMALGHASPENRAQGRPVLEYHDTTVFARVKVEAIQKPSPAPRAEAAPQTVPGF